MDSKWVAWSGVRVNWLDPSPRGVVREWVLGVRLGQDGEMLGSVWLENSWYPGILETSGYLEGCGCPLGRSQKLVGVSVPFGYVGCLGLLVEYGVFRSDLAQHDTRLENSVRSSGSRLCCLA